MILGSDELSWKSQKARRKFARIRTSKQLIKFLEDRNFSHDYYYHYTSSDNFLKICKSHELWCTSPTLSNDKAEKNELIDKHIAIFSSSFSSPLDKEESIPMTYLYGGGMGYAIKFQKDFMQFLANKKCDLHLRNKDTQEKYQLESKDYDITIKDVIYFHQYNDREMLMICHGLFNDNITVTEFNKFKNVYQLYCKDYCWNYENEVRILISLSNDIADSININDYVIAIDIEKYISKSKITAISGPESTCNHNLSINTCYSSLKNKIEFPFLRWNSKEL